jgi:hypothetical protein
LVGGGENASVWPKKIICRHLKNPADVFSKLLEYPGLFFFEQLYLLDGYSDNKLRSFTALRWISESVP